MALTAWPFADVDTTEDQYGALFQKLQDDGFDALPTDTDGRVSVGSGLTVQVAAFSLAYLGGTAVTSTSVQAVTLAAASASSRVDRIVLRITSGNTLTIDRLTGTSGSASPPAVTQTPGGVYELPLARVTVAAGATTLTTAAVVDERPFLSARVGKWTTATRPGTPGQRPVRDGDFGFNFTTRLFEGWNGTGWVGAGSGGSGGATTKAFNPSTGLYEAVTGDFFVGSTAPSTGVDDGDLWLTTA